MTKKYRSRRWIFTILSFICVWGPAVFYIIQAFATGQAHTKSGFTLGATCIVAILLCVVSAVFKHHWRTPAVIILISLYTFANNFGAILLSVGIGVILDEIIFTPLANHYRNLYTINREIDRR